MATNDRAERYPVTPRQDRGQRLVFVDRQDGGSDVLPELPPLHGWAELPDPRQLLPTERREKLANDLGDIVRKRRQAESRATSLRLS